MQMMIFESAYSNGLLNKPEDMRKNCAPINHLGDSSININEHLTKHSVIEVEGNFKHHRSTFVNMSSVITVPYDS